MTTTVQTAAAAENIGSGLAWADTTNSLIDDALSASVTFDGTNSDSQLLWVHDFGFTFPTTELSIDGISAKVLRTGTGLTEDLQVVLTHGATPTLTSPSKHQAGTWVSDVDGTTNYGGVSDIWNRVWSGSEVNDSNFGFAISAESTMNFDAGLVDFVELTVESHRIYVPAPTGGSMAGGSATVAYTSNTALGGGSISGGHANLQFDDIAIGGSLTGGVASPVHDFIQPVGGGINGGVATELTLHITAISGGPLAGGTANVDFQDNFNGTGGIVAGGEASPVHDFIQPVGGALASAPIVLSYTSTPPISGGVIGSGISVVDPYVGHGGSLASGTAVVDAIYNHVPAGGSITGGLALQRLIIPTGGGAIAGGIGLDSKRFDEIATGGISVLVGTSLQETAIIEPFFEVGRGGAAVEPISFVDPYLPVGGLIAGGLAKQTQNYDTNLNPNEIQVIARGDHFVPPNATTESAICGFTFNPVDRTLSWNISHSIPGLSRLRIRGPAAPGVAGGNSIVAIDTINDVSQSPIEGSKVLNPTQATWYQDGLLWIFFNTGGISLRAQIKPFDGVLAGGATPFIFTEDSIGGSITGGSATVQQTIAIVTTGGAITSGLASEGRQLIESGLGGAITSGISVIQFTGNQIATGGAIVSGLAIDEAIYTVLGTGGGIAAGRGIIGIAPKIGGGAIVAGLLAGTDAIQYTSNPIVGGGGLGGGKARQTFIDQVIVVAHVIVGGSSIGSKIKFFRTQKNGYGRAMESDNILTNVPDDTPKLIPPTNDVSPELELSRFRIQHNPGWCEVPVKCDEGVLAEVIVKRQKGIVPPKIRDGSGRSSTITSAAL
jgi:hypothetical protein